MHETVIASKIIRNVKKKVKKGHDVTGLLIEVGELAHLPAHELRDILETLTKWKIIVKIIKASAKCSCGFKGHPKILERGHEFCIYICPKCSKVPKLIDGEDIIIKKINQTKIVKGSD